jgi:hypothetical protein
MTNHEIRRLADRVDRVGGRPVKRSPGFIDELEPRGFALMLNPENWPAEGLTHSDTETPRRVLAELSADERTDLALAIAAINRSPEGTVAATIGALPPTQLAAWQKATARYVALASEGDAIHD